MTRDCKKCKHYKQCLEWDCLKDPNECEFYEELKIEDLNEEDLKKIDNLFKRFYEMEFEEFREIVEMITKSDMNGIKKQNDEDLKMILEDFELWSRVKLALNSSADHILNRSMDWR